MWQIPNVNDEYSNLFWMAYKGNATGKSANSQPWPYLSWARAHFYGDKGGTIMGNREYPLSWETGACCADYNPIDIISAEHKSRKVGSPHTWHSAEMFLYLIEAGGKPNPVVSLLSRASRGNDLIRFKNFPSLSISPIFTSGDAIFDIKGKRQGL